MDDFLPPQTPTASYEDLFVTETRHRIQSPAQSHEYKKKAGSSDAAKTYDTTAI
ncbi:hypothetical protein LI90_3679 [Carbonactinospora thermoautotrophica]|uniref:Uncharacterized protein n=1 Tax=Carbonactinospora thermoautotrophica TaxID=1469144 RepID=A0A132MY27_9ACTN|nr:hypothetical protein [Carbonactinospora thermoautotrophica]KWX02636.1 hypothetical protein LI90_3679 [Carbonactinospora thermoautotrophica]